MKSHIDMRNCSPPMCSLGTNLKSIKLDVLATYLGM